MERAEKNKMTKYEVLKKYFGYDSFREGQEMLVDALLNGQDVLGIMPTGAGKSLCYQIPALLLPGITLVVSPLISLMKDQVSTLNQAGIHAAFLNSSLSAAQYRKALGFAMEGRYKIIYVAPERLLTPEFLCAVQSMEISMISVDEAHCISQWGQDFRPSYLKITEFVEQLPARPVIGAFTATATKEVRDDIEALLSLRDPVRLVTGFDRKNLKFTVQQPKDKFAAVESFLAEHEADCGIIYCLTRKNVEEVCEKLEQKGYSVTRYHAGLSDLERKENQEDFIYDRKQIMVATNAFGMGIDKSNVRYVIHYNMPKNMESYYQEAGRAGRDGLPAECILLYAGQDVITNQFFIENMAQESEDPETTALIRQREEERLKKMTFYCFTHECLRDYILRYFGEYGSNYCGNCSNCLSEFETVDVTAAAKAILGCVRECRQRYGTTVILDTLHGANTAKIRQYRMDENTHYGELAKEPVYRLRQILNELQVREYLYVTADTYSIVRLLPKAAELLDEETRIFVNPTGRFVIGGPQGDSGLTGRKIIVDTYGGSAPHGGGAFSGKDPTKVDRSAAYAARWVAKNVVAAGLARRCQVQLAYAIGVARPVSVRVDTFGTGTVPDEQLSDAVEQVFDLRPAAIIRDLGLRRPIYRQLAAYGHFGRDDLDLSWEKTDRAEALKAAL